MYIYIITRDSKFEVPEKTLRKARNKGKLLEFQVNGEKYTAIFEGIGADKARELARKMVDKRVYALGNVEARIDDVERVKMFGGGYKLRVEFRTKYGSLYRTIYLFDSKHAKRELYRMVELGKKKFSGVRKFFRYIKKKAKDFRGNFKKGLLLGAFYQAFTLALRAFAPSYAAELYNNTVGRIKRIKVTSEDARIKDWKTSLAYAAAGAVATGLGFAAAAPFIYPVLGILGGSRAYWKKKEKEAVLEELARRGLYSSSI